MIVKYTKDRLIALTAEALKGQVPDPTKVSAALRDCLEVTPPRTVVSRRDPNAGPLIGFIVLNSESDSGKSVKPGNIRLNWKRVLSSTPDIGMTGFEVHEHHWLVFFAAYTLWEKLLSIATSPLSKDRAITLGALWSVVPLRKTYSEEDALKIVNDFRSQRSMAKLDAPKFAKIVEALDRMECIELNSGKITLVEKVEWETEE
jgi:hypothetical protein